MFNRNRIQWAICLLFVAFFMTGCFPVSMQMDNVPKDDLPGFWTALYHGGLAPISWVVSFFNESVSVKATSNSGTGYSAGFYLGALLTWLEPVAKVAKVIIEGMQGNK